MNTGEEWMLELNNLFYKWTKYFRIGSYEITIKKCSCIEIDLD